MTGQVSFSLIHKLFLLIHKKKTNKQKKKEGQTFEQGIHRQENAIINKHLKIRTTPLVAWKRNLSETILQLQVVMLEQQNLVLLRIKLQLAIS